jgi:hypothetical protein
MNKPLKKVKVKKSVLPGAGKGLFAGEDIRKGNRIVEYTGEITTWKDVVHDEGKNGYIYYVKRNYVIDAGKTKDALARYANDARGIGRLKGITNNAKYIEDGLQVFIQATKNIPAGGEILVEYGKEYWDAIRYNIKLEAEERKAAERSRRSPAK